MIDAEEKEFVGYLKGDKVYVNKSNANGLLSKGFGKLGRKYLTLNPLETLYLVFKEKLVVFKDNKKFSFEELVKKFSSINPRILSQFLVYRDLRSRGYIVELGYGETIDFLVYDKGEYPNKPAKYRVIGVDEGIPIKIEKLLDILNFTVMNKKELKLAVIERRGEVVYYTLNKFFRERLDEKT